MVLYVSGNYEKDILRKALCEYLAEHENEYALKLLNRVVKCMGMQDRKEKAVTPKDNG